MPTALARAVKSRLEQLDRNPFEAARVGGLERSFINDILIGRKKTIRGDNIAKAAHALDWPTAELMLRIDGKPATELHRRRLASGLTLRQLAEASKIEIDRLERAEEGYALLSEEEYGRVGAILRIAPESLAPTDPVGAPTPQADQIDAERLTPFLVAAFEELGLSEEKAANLASALIAASAMPQDHAEPGPAMALTRALARSLVRLFAH